MDDKYHPRILIVDDEPAIRKLLTAAFLREGYEVQAAASGDEAASICCSQRFDVLLSDVRMPGLNGHELVRAVVEQNHDTVCVLMSGYDNFNCVGCGQCVLLSKPFLARQAVSLVKELLH